MTPPFTRHICRVLSAALVVAAVAVAAPGCRAIRRFGETRQSIDARRLSGLGLQAMHDGQWEMAESLFTDALDVSTSDDRAHWGLAESYWKRDERDLAIKHMQQAVRLSASDPRLVQRLGRMYLDLGHLEEADRQSHLALASNRDSASAWALRGDCLRAADQPQQALAAYHRALALQPDYPEVQIQAAEIYRQQEKYGRMLATLDLLQDSVGIDNAPACVDLLQGIAMREMGKSEDARRCFLRAASKDSADAAPHLELAALNYQVGDIAAARESLAIAARLAPESVQESEWINRFETERRLAEEGGESAPKRR